MLMYIFLGFLDSAALITLMFALYRFPYKEYIIEILIMAVWNAIVSYLMREVVELPVVDPLVQIALIIFFLRYVIKVKYIYASLITVSGYVGYILIQSMLIFSYTATGLIQSEDTAQSSSAGAITIQVSAIVLTVLIVSLMRYFNKGFQFIIRPPHDFNVRERNIVGNRFLWLSIGLAVIVVVASTALLLHMSPLLIIPLCLSSSLVLYYLSYRRELLDRDRIVIPKGLNNNKTLGQ